MFAEGEEKVVNPLMKLPLLPAVLRAVCRCLPRRCHGACAWPRDHQGAALVCLHEMHIKIRGVLVHFFRMQMKRAVPETS